MKLILYSNITCPDCGFFSKEEMPTDSCQFFWQCPECKSIIKPERGDCCVFCSYGDTPCPPVQQGTGC
ncbi:GDCCVxC domain-containing (seleno)protein [Gracilimonas sp.]|uniref:GDCCVxC domain-containing (seleno)protein n=1 Tax=Gracilimonas sp. TaxID=1974203 RepID=UPI003BAC4218